jgi:hypothetical protein
MAGTGTEHETKELLETESCNVSGEGARPELDPFQPCRQGSKGLASADAVL